MAKWSFGRHPKLSVMWSPDGVLEQKQSIRETKEIKYSMDSSKLYCTDAGSSLQRHSAQVCGRTGTVQQLHSFPANLILF